MIDIRVHPGQADHNLTVTLGDPPAAAAESPFPAPCKFLTLAEQVESMLRFDGRWGPDAARLFEKELADMSDPAVPGLPELVGWVRTRSDADFPAHVRWRVNLAREVVGYAHGPAAGDYTHKLKLTAELWARNDDWPVPVLEIVGRWLSAWARLKGTAELKTDRDVFRGIADHVDGKAPTPAAQTATAPTPVAPSHPAQIPAGVA